MSLKSRLRVSIVALAAFIVIALSGLYLNDFITLAFDGAQSRAVLVGNEVRDYVSERISDEIAARQIHPADEREFRAAALDIVRNDPRIARELRNSRANYEAVLNVEILADGKLLVAADPAAAGPAEYPVYHFEALRSRNALLKLWDLFFRREDYATSVPVSIVGRPEAPPVFTIKVILRSVLLSKVLEPALYRLAAAFFSGLAVAMFLGALLPNLFIGPLERLRKQIESISSDDAAIAPAPPRPESAEFAAVQSKLNLLGQQFRGARQDAKELRRNVEQLLERLEEAVLLFDASGHLLMAGHAAGRLIGQPPLALIGHTVDQVFTAERNAREIADAIRRRKPWRDHAVVLKNGVSNEIRTLVTVEPLENVQGGNVGTLITLRDADTRRQLETQLDVSARLAALGRLTSGVAHEIKNPLNAMALHLEVLKSRIAEAQPEVEVIAREIKRLDHVVKTFLNFSKPLEVQMTTLNLSALAEDTVMLVMPDAKARGITIETACSPDASISGDQDLIRQALLNVVMNAIEAMPEGGRVTVRTEASDGESTIIVSDTGPGIPPEAHDKIFHLYYTTKSNGSGIGLAMTFRVIQLHGGTIDFVSAPDKGTSFRLRFPRLAGYSDEPLSRAAGSGRKL